MRKSLAFTGAALSSLHGLVQDQGTAILEGNISALAERDASYAVTLNAPLNVNMQNMYAGHRSHSSHSSHRSHSSHSSHYSGSGSSYSAPAAPRSTYVPPATPLPPKSTYTPPTTYRPSVTSPASSTHQYATPKASTESTKPWRNYGSQQLPESGTAPRPSADQVQLMIMRVQAALYSKGYDPGAIDGVLGATTKAALRTFQTDHGLVASGAMTTETLNALGISLRP